MSIKTIDSALDFLPEVKNAASAHFKTAMTIFRGIGEGLAAAAAYESQVARGVPANVAVRRIFEAYFATR